VIDISIKRGSTGEQLTRNFRLLAKDLGVLREQFTGS
jgi:hypothetical protein